jgi:hypothetical protein
MQNFPFAAQQEQVNKFLEATRMLGAQMDSQQGTTRIIYDTQDVTTAPNTTTSYDFFSQVSSKTFPATNINDNRFEPGEGMVIKEIIIANTQGTTPAAVVNTLLGATLVNVLIGNNRVIKDLPLWAFGGLTAINNLNPTTSTAIAGVRLLTNIVIPPQVQFVCNLRTPQSPLAAAGITFRVYFKGYGKLFNPRNNY